MFRSRHPRRSPQSRLPTGPTLSDVAIEVDDLTIAGYLAMPERLPLGGCPGLVICHGFPTAAIGAARSGHSYHSLADRIADSKGCAVLVIHYRGVGGSSGNFSIGGWLADVEAAIDYLNGDSRVATVSVIGFGTGAALAICAAANRPEVRAVAAFAPPADFADWSSSPDYLLAHAREIGAITDDEFPQDLDAWSQELAHVVAADAAAEFAPRPLMVLHGQEDDVVPLFDSRIVADSHGSAELRIISGAGHLLRYDPRAVAMLLGWIDRHRYGGD